MRDSLAILLLVHNCQSQLESLVAGLLDVAADLTRQLDLVIVDDGSNDGTEEIAWELATRYAQVDYLRHPFLLGRQESVRSGLATTRGNFVLVCDSIGPLDIENVVHLWRDRHHTAAVGGPAANQQLAVPPLAKTGRPKKWWRRQLVHYGQSLRKASHRPHRQTGMSMVLRSDLAEAVGQACHPRTGRFGNLSGKQYRTDGDSSVRSPTKPGRQRPDPGSATPPESTRDYRAALDRLKQGARGV
ncbi:MAG: glycosyltransferase [Planctomycetota bacterium]|nr:glycosyltransferase [Planctomycetota bacterium]